MEFVKEEEFGIFEGSVKACIRSKFFSDLAREYYLLEIDDSYEKIMNVNARLHSRKTQVALWSILKSKIYQNLDNLDRENIGIIVMTGRNYVTEEFPKFDFEESDYYSKLRSTINPTYVIKNESGIIPGHLAIALRIHGPTYTLISDNLNQAISFLRLELMNERSRNIIFVCLKTFEDEFANKIMEISDGNRELVGCFLVNSENLKFQEKIIKDLKWN